MPHIRGALPKTGMRPTHIHRRLLIVRNLRRGGDSIFKRSDRNWPAKYRSLLMALALTGCLTSSILEGYWRNLMTMLLLPIDSSKEPERGGVA